MTKGQGKGKVKAPTDETKADRFVRVATPRVKKLLWCFKQLANCSGAAYEYTPEQVTKISETIVKAFDDMVDRLNRKKPISDEFAF
jgi:hypothetical protein